MELCLSNFSGFSEESAITVFSTGMGAICGGEVAAIHWGGSHTQPAAAAQRALSG